jgi:glycosyltransferase involved in cell wall biosynthesis
MTAEEVDLVSVLLPVFNGAATIRRAVDSVLGQTHAALELVVVDDGSTDGTREYLDALQDERVRVVRHRRNMGLVAALNTGLEACRGDLIARLDADDVAHPRRIERQAGVFRNDPDVVLCSTAYDRVDEAGRALGTRVPPTTHAAMAIGLVSGNRINHSTVMFRKFAVWSAGGYDANWFPAEDYDLWLRLMQEGQFAGISSSEATSIATIDGISSTLASLQRRKATERAARYRAELLGGEPQSATDLTVRQVSRLAKALEGDLRRRQIETRGLYAQALMLAHAAAGRRSRVNRRMRVALGAPVIVLRSRSDRS